MPRMQRYAACCFVLAVAAGCGNGYVKPKGRLMKNGEPFVPADNEVVHVALFPVKDAKVAAPAAAPEGAAREAGSFPANFNREDGTFRVTGMDGRGMPPGKYRVTVQVMKNKKDVLKGAFGAQNSPLVHDIDSSSQELTVDLAKPKG
jgi:hypothetical protein